MNESDLFKIKSYGFQELAALYSPEISPGSAARRLRRWIGVHPTLGKDLKKAGWRKGLRILSPRLVKIFIHHLGEP